MRPPAKRDDVGANPARNFNRGDMREQANPAGCEPVCERIDTAMSPSPVSTMAVQEICNLPIEVRFLGRAPFY
jgi:hypothetical protein